jgi:hypothetical protein
MVKMYTVNCMMCGRSSGQVRNRVFHRAQGAPRPEKRAGRMLCGFCSGNLYLEPDDSLMSPPPSDERVLLRRQRLAS